VYVAGSVWAERIQNPRDIFAKMRIVKSEAEINLMRKAASIAAHSFIEAMKFTRAGMPEYQLAAKLEYECRLRGAQRLSYPPVVAGGINANTLHYVSNDMLLPKDELVLVDAGADYHGYVSDITRTWPISNTFSKPQLAIYNLVLAVNQRCIQVFTLCLR
jgi:Xaa-Pro aminopeptidase